jgi:hypothetical protein
MQLEHTHVSAEKYINDHLLRNTHAQSHSIAGYSSPSVVCVGTQQYRLGACVVRNKRQRVLAASRFVI